MSPFEPMDTRKRIALGIVASLLGLGTLSCAHHAESDLKGTLNLTVLTDEIRLDINTVAQESESLVSGGRAMLVPRDGGLIANASTLYVVRAGKGTWSKPRTGEDPGSISVDPLPAPGGRMTVQFSNVRAFSKEGGASRISGEASFTYLGAVMTTKAVPRACPAVPEYSGKMIL